VRKPRHRLAVPITIGAVANCDRLTERRFAQAWLAGTTAISRSLEIGKARSGDLVLLRSKARRFSVEAMRTVAVDAERNYLMVAGPVPGWDTGLVYVRKVGAMGKGRA